MPKLSEEIEWKKTFWLTNYVKTITTASFVSGAIASLTEGIVTGSVALYILSISLWGIASAQLYYIDRYGEQKKREELDAIDERIEATNAKMDEILEKNFHERSEKFIERLEKGA